MTSNDKYKTNISNPVSFVPFGTEITSLMLDTGKVLEYSGAGGGQAAADTGSSTHTFFTSQPWENIKAALSGGTPTFNFFSNGGAVSSDTQVDTPSVMGGMQQMQQLLLAAQFDTNWGDAQYKIDGFNYPAKYLEADGFYIIIKPETVIAKPTDKDTRLDEDSNSWTQAGTMSIEFVGTNVSFHKTVMGIEYSSGILAGISAMKFIQSTFGDFIKSCWTGFKSFVSKRFSSNKPDSDLEQALNDSDADAADAETDSAVSVDLSEEGLEGGVEITSSFVSTAFAGAAGILALGLIAVVVVLALLTSTFVSYVRVYNCTDMALEVYVCYSYDMVSGNPTMPVTLPALTVNGSLPGGGTIQGGSVSYTALQAQNSDDLKGLGFGISVYENDVQNGFASSFYVDIPKAGDNSQWVSWGGGDNSCQNTYASGQGLNNEFDAYWYSNNSPTGIAIATNQLSGESSDPITGETGYYYEYLVVIAPKKELATLKLPQGQTVPFIS